MDRKFDLRDHVPGPTGMLGAAANVVMQLGHPSVGYGVQESVVDSGNVLLHPWKRLRTTITYLTVALFGTDAERATYREAVNRSHVPVQSGPNSPVKYNAFDPALQLWVAACLYVGVRDVRLAFFGPMTEADAEALYWECRRLGTSLQVLEESWPPTRAAFDEYWRTGLSQIRYDEPVRAHLLKVVDLAMLPRWMRWGTASFNRFCTVGFLPPEVRTAMVLPWSDRDQRRFDRLVKVLRAATRLMPRWLRMMGFQLQLREFRGRVRRGRRLT
jgi:uncharacterized protein (DUF2236 family)